MTKRFPLQSLLELREREADIAERTFAAACTEQAECERQQATAEHALCDALEARTRLAEQRAVGLLATSEPHVQRLQRGAADAKAARKRSAEALAVARANIAQRQAARKAVETECQKWLAEQARLLERRAEDAADDRATAQFVAQRRQRK